MKMSRIQNLIWLGTIFLLLLTGCEYEGPTAVYYQAHLSTPSPSINRITPPNEAVPGVNYITIEGQNFSAVPDQNKVYFDGYQAEIVSSSTTAITVRRPNKVGDSTTVAVVNNSALQVAKHGPYKIKPVLSTYGQFLQGDQLSAVAVDAQENVYVVQRTPRTVYKVNPDGEKTILGEAARTVTDAMLSPGGTLLLLMNNRMIGQINVETGEYSEWVNLSKRVAFGDFDSNGFFYTGGSNTDLLIIAPDLSTRLFGVYAQSDIRGVRVFSGYVYIFAENSRPTEDEPALAFWRHPFGDSPGTLGEKELVLDWATTGEYAASEVKDFTFSADGVLYVGTDDVHPLFMLNPDQSQDILYKGILPAYTEQIVWGNGNYLYIIQGGDKWDLLRVDMGAPGAPYYGRR